MPSHTHCLEGAPVPTRTAVSPALPLLPLGLQALTRPPSPLSVSTVCCLTNSSSRKGEFIEEKDQSFCWKMLFPVLVSCFLALHIHTQGQHMLGSPVQETEAPPGPGGALPHPLKEKPLPPRANKPRPGTARPLPYLPRFSPEAEGGGAGEVMSLPPQSYGVTAD